MKTTPELPEYRFTVTNSGGHNMITHPWYHRGYKDTTEDESYLVLKVGWKVLGWRERLPDHLMKDMGFSDVMFESPDGHEYWFHVYIPDYDTIEKEKYIPHQREEKI